MTRLPDPNDGEVPEIRRDPRPDRDGDREPGPDGLPPPRPGMPDPDAPEGEPPMSAPGADWPPAVRAPRAPQR